MTDPAHRRREFEYDVALSYASEQRQYVEQVADTLSGLGIRPFYDAHEKADLWGKDLYDHLERWMDVGTVRRIRSEYVDRVPAAAPRKQAAS